MNTMTGTLNNEQKSGDNTYQEQAEALPKFQ